MAFSPATRAALQTGQSNYGDEQMFWLEAALDRLKALCDREDRERSSKAGETAIRVSNKRKRQQTGRL